MSGVYLVYELKTPTTESADPYQHIQNVGTTEEWLDSRAVPVPVSSETFYPNNIRKAVESIPVAPTNNGTYVLKVTVTSGVPSYEWVAET